MSLPVFWFGTVAVLWSGFFVLEGFDFGVGALHRVVGRTELERRVMINSIGPFWDGNEVWLITGGAAIFAAFPGWYATWFSAGYLALVLVLLALMLRGVSFEFRGHVDSDRWRASWSWCLVGGSTLAPLLLGIALGDLLAGLPVDDQQEFTGTFWDLLTPYGLVLGVTMLALCLLHGATFLGLRTLDVLRARTHRAASLLVWPAVLLVLVVAVWTPTLSDQGFLWSVLPLAVAVLTVAASALLLRVRREGWAFAATAVTIGLVPLSVFTNLYPRVLVSSTSAANDLTVDNTASGHYALVVMTWVVVILLPVVLLYQGWTYVVFRHRLALPPSGPPVSRTADEGVPA